MVRVRRYRPELENIFPWIKRDPEGSEKAYCDLCEVLITPTAACLSTHEASARHQVILYEVKTTGQKPPIKPKIGVPKPPSWKKEYDERRTFREKWIERYPWIQPHPESDRYGICPYCKIRLEPKTREIEQHMRTSKHRRNMGLMVPMSRKGKRKRRHGHGLKKRRGSETDYQHPDDFSELMEDFPNLLEVEVDEDETSDWHPTKGKFIDVKQEAEEGEEEGPSGQVETGEPTSPKPFQKNPPTKRVQALKFKKKLAHRRILLEKLARIKKEVPDESEAHNHGEQGPGRSLQEGFGEGHGEHQGDGEHHGGGGEGSGHPGRAFYDQHMFDGHMRAHHSEGEGMSHHDDDEDHDDDDDEEGDLLQETEIVAPKREPGQEDDSDQMNQSRWKKDYDKSRKFQLAWFYEHPWVRKKKLAGDVEIVYCPFCKVDIEPRIVRIRQHENSWRHRQAEETSSLHESDEEGVEIPELDIQAEIRELEQAQFQETDFSGDHKPVKDDATRQNTPRTPKNSDGSKGSTWKREYEHSRRFQVSWLRDHPWLEHRLRDDGTDTAFCPFCNIELELRIARIQQHEESRKHQRNADKYLNRDGNEFDDETDLPRSDGIKTEVRPRYTCDICGMKFVAQRNLFFHFKEHYETGDFSFMEPTRVMADDDSPPSARRPKSKPVYNPNWEKIFPWLEKAVDDEWAFCSLCQFAMEPSLSVVKAHVNHKRHANLVAAQPDPLRYATKVDLYGVLKENDKKEKRKLLFDQNADVFVDTDGKEKCQCKICHKIMYKSSFEVHFVIHQGIRPFKCEMCNWAFKQSHTLKHHIESVHRKEKPHQCELCGREFSRKYSLRLHMKKHANVRDHVCQVCSRGFFTRQKLIEHGRTHTGEKPYPCDICGRGFRIKYEMIQHRNKTHLGLPDARKKNRPVGAKPDHPMQPVQPMQPRPHGFMTEEVMDMSTSGSEHTEEVQVHLPVPQEPKRQLVYISETEAVFVTK